jgi:methionyl-tRNA formyltransferase
MLRVLVVSASPFLAGAWTTADEARGHQPVAYLTTPGPPRRRLEGYEQIAEQFGAKADVVVSSKPSLWRRMFEAYDLDLITCCGFPWRLPADLLELPRLGAINAHPSLLPMYRGAGPNVFGWMFRNDEHEGGATVHRMSAEFDTGAILAQARIPIEDDDDAGAVTRRLGEVFMQVLDAGLAAAEAGEPGREQEGEGFYAVPFEEEWRHVDWARPAREVHNQVRSWTGMESQGHAVAVIAGQDVIVRRTRLPQEAATNGAAAPGTVLSRDGDELVIQCGDGPLLVVDWGPASNTLPSGEG